ncbi:MAG: heme-dependent oxidative N-demethylase subunit alpha family protein [Bacteriovoracaceae bacterium]
MVLDFKGLNSDYLDYDPFRLGLGPSKIALRKLEFHKEKSQDRERVFQVDPEFYTLYHDSKTKMRKDHPELFYHSNINEKTLERISEYLLNLLSKEYPHFFEYQKREGSHFVNNKIINKESSFEREKNHFIDLFDFFAMNVQEDFALVNVSHSHLTTDLIHLSHPNEWTAKWGIGKTFDELHLRIQDIDKVIKYPEKVFMRIKDQNFQFERLGAMTLTTWPNILRLPEYEEKPLAEDQRIYLRFERQTLSYIPETDYLLFTIRPYIKDFTKEIKNQLSYDELKYFRDHKNRYQWFIKKNFKELETIINSQ